MTDPDPINGLLEAIGRVRLRITDIKVTPLTYRRPDGGYLHECGPVVLTQYHSGVLQLFTDAGLVGIGPAVQETTESAARLLGANPFDAVTTRLSSGLDMACWDLIGKALGRPVYQLLAMGHTPEPRVHVYASGGVLWTYYDRGDGQPYGVEQLIDEARRYRELGYDTFKWRPGTDWEEAGMNAARLGEVCRRLREAVGPDLALGLEKKGYDSWTLDECLEIAPVLSDLGFLFFEQPMGDEGPAQFDDYLKLKERMPGVMLWGGERFGGLAEAQPWLERRIYDAVQPDAYHLGVTELWRIGRQAACHGVKLVPHNWSSSLGTVANCHVVAGTPSGHRCEFFLYPNGFRDGLLREPYRPVGSYVDLTDAPGFGVELVDDPAAIFPHHPGPTTVANPRFPHAWERARRREEAVRQRYAVA